MNRLICFFTSHPYFIKSTETITRIHWRGFRRVKIITAREICVRCGCQRIPNPWGPTDRADWRKSK